MLFARADMIGGEKLLDYIYSYVPLLPTNFDPAFGLFVFAKEIARDDFCMVNKKSFADRTKKCLSSPIL